MPDEAKLEISLKPEELPEGCEPMLLFNAPFTVDADGTTRGTEGDAWSCGSQHGTCHSYILPIHPLSRCAHYQELGKADPCCSFHAYVKELGRGCLG